MSTQTSQLTIKFSTSWIQYDTLLLLKVRCLQLRQKRWPNVPCLNAHTYAFTIKQATAVIFMDASKPAVNNSKRQHVPINSRVTKPLSREETGTLSQPPDTATSSYGPGFVATWYARGEMGQYQKGCPLRVVSFERWTKVAIQRQQAKSPALDKVRPVTGKIPKNEPAYEER